MAHHGHVGAARRRDVPCGVMARRRRVRRGRRRTCCSSSTTTTPSVLTLLDRRTAFRAILDRLPDETGIDVAWIGELDADGNVVLGHAVRTRTDAVDGLVVPPGVGLGGRVLQTGRPQWVANYPVGADLTSPSAPTPTARASRAWSRSRWSTPAACSGSCTAPTGPRRSYGDLAVAALEAAAARAANAAVVAERARHSAEVAVHEERRRLALELHDTVGAMLFTIGAGRPEAQRRARRGSRPPGAARVDRAPGRRGGGGVPRVAPGAARARPTRSRWPSRSGPTAGASRSAPASRPGCWCSTTCRRCRRRAPAPWPAAVREALLNVEKHARASSVLVSVFRAGEGVTVAMHDDGVGPPADAGDERPGSGWPRPTERLGRVGGYLTVGGNDDGGVTVRALGAGMTRADTISVLVVDDHPIVLDGVRHLVDSTPWISLAGYARTGREAITLAEQTQPDVVLLDLRLPDMLGPEVVRGIHRGAPAARIVLFTAHPDHAAVEPALAAGARRSCSRTPTGPTSSTSSAGSPPASRSASTPGRPTRRASGSPASCGSTALTRREYDILRRISMGETNPEIAEALGLTRNTVKTYVQTALYKLGARNRIEALNRLTSSASSNAADPARPAALRRRRRLAIVGEGPGDQLGAELGLVEQEQVAAAPHHVEAAVGQ